MPIPLSAASFPTVLRCVRPVTSQKDRNDALLMLLRYTTAQTHYTSCTKTRNVFQGRGGEEEEILKRGAVNSKVYPHLRYNCIFMPTKHLNTNHRALKTPPYTSNATDQSDIFAIGPLLDSLSRSLYSMGAGQIGNQEEHQGRRRHREI